MSKLGKYLISLAMQSNNFHKAAFRYRGFLLLEQHNQSWLVRPERSPMYLLPFRTHICSLTEVKNLLDNKLDNNPMIPNAA